MRQTAGGEAGSSSCCVCEGNCCSVGGVLSPFVCVASIFLGVERGRIYEFEFPLIHRQFRARNGTNNNTHILLHYAESWLLQVLLERSKSRRPNGASLLEDNATKSGESAYSMHENA